jgi:hypothetical protein
MKQGHNIHWNIPFEVHRRDAIRELLNIFTPAVLARIIFAIIAVFLGAFFASQRYLPGLEFDWVMAFLKSIGALLFILATLCLITFVPPAITVTSKGITVFQGQSAKLHLFRDLVECRIIEESGLYYLVFRRGDQAKTRKLAVSPKIDIEQLLSILNTPKIS